MGDPFAKAAGHLEIGEAGGEGPDCGGWGPGVAEAAGDAEAEGRGGQGGQEGPRAGPIPNPSSPTPTFVSYQQTLNHNS